MVALWWMVEFIDSMVVIPICLVVYPAIWRFTNLAANMVEDYSRIYILRSTRVYNSSIV
jgi:integral membrane sensor domain MASE1